MAEQLFQITLAHPLGTDYAKTLGLPPRKYKVNETLTLRRQLAMQLVAAGYVAGAEPTNPATIAKALRPVAPAKPTAPAKPSKTSGGTTK